MSKKYGALGIFLRHQQGDEVTMSFAQIERIIGSALPANSQNSPAWWSNASGNNVMTKVWLDAGFKSERVDIKGRKLVFKRIPGEARRSGMEDEAREFKPAENGGEKKPYRHPLWGSMKGTFTLVPPPDDEPPPEDPDSWEALALAKLDRLLFGKGE